MAALSVFTIILSLLSTELSFVFAGFGTVTAYHPPYLPTRCNGNGQEQFPPGNLFVAVGECLWDNGAACGSLWGNGAACGRRYRLRCISGNNKPCKGNTINQFPISLTMIHMFFCGTLAFLLIKVFKFVEPVTMSRCLFLSSVVPIGALYSLSLWLSNSAYIYLSVSFIQMLKALMPVAVYSIGVTFKKESFKSDTMCNMVSISVGVAIAAYGEAKFDSWGVVLQLGAVAFEATRLVMIQILLTSKGITLNPITSLYYVAPCCLVFLLVPWIFVELPILRETSSFHFDFEIFGTNSLCAFALNLAVFLLVGKTSPLTMNVAGVVKDWLLIAFSWSAIKDTITPINLFGYGLAFSGVAYYSISKLLALKAKEAQKKAQQADEEAGKVLEERDGEGGGSTNRNESQD